MKSETAYPHRGIALGRYGRYSWAMQNDNDGYRKQVRSNQYTRRTYRFKGKNLTVTEWARETGIKRATINNRMKWGWPLNKTLTVQAEAKHPTYRFDGHNLTLAQLARVAGIPATAMRWRLKHGWSVERAATKPKRGKK